MNYYFFKFFSGRRYKHRVCDVPTKTAKTRTFSEDNQGFEEGHYSEIPAEDHTYENPLSQWKSPGHEVVKNHDLSLQNTDYQHLHFVNGRPEPTYAGVKTESEL